MSRVSAAQRARLGAFLMLSGAIFTVAVLALVGSAILEKRDEYLIRFQGSVSGLDAGATVTYNGIRVGRIEDVRIDPEDVSSVRVRISLRPGTPVKKDTLASVNMQGITGLKNVELSGGSNTAEVLEPGSYITSRVSTFDELTDMAASIGRKLEVLGQNLADITGGDTAKNLQGVLEETRGLLSDLRAVLGENRGRLANAIEEASLLAEEVRLTIEESRPNVSSIIGNLEVASEEVGPLLKQSRESIANVSHAANVVSLWVTPEQVAKVAGAVEGALRTAERRLSKKELGSLLERLNKLSDRSTTLVEHADITLMRARDDLIRALDEFVTGAESFADFAAYIRDNPSALISGRTEEERKIQ